VDLLQGRIDRLIYGDVNTTFGSSESEIHLRLGQPTDTEKRAIPNLHVKGVLDTHIKMIYDGLTIDLLHSGTTGADLLVRMVLQNPGYVFTGGIGIGIKKQGLESYLGPPWKTGDSGEYIYGDSEGNSTVTFGLEKDGVKSITWSYYLD
jgi:hypothetical protein